MIRGGLNKRDCRKALEKYAAGVPLKKLLAEERLPEGTFYRHLAVARFREPEKFGFRYRIKES